MISAHIRDAAALAARSPAELSTYLRAHGWLLAHRTETVAFWTLVMDGDELEIMQPLDPGLRDYALRVGDAIVVLSAAEGRSELEIRGSLIRRGTRFYLSGPTGLRVLVGTEPD